MTFKTYCKLLFHAVVCLLIVLSLPVITIVIFYNFAPNWVTLLAGIVSAFPTIYWMIKYIFKHCDNIF